MRFRSKAMAVVATTVVVAGTLIGGSIAHAAVSPKADVLLSQGQPVTASSSGGCCAAANAVDGSTTTRWASAANIDPSWIYVDLGATAAIHRVQIAWDASCATAYQVQTSTDAASWTSIYNTTAGNGGTDNLTGLNGSGRYVRVYGTHRCRTDASKGYSIDELQVYGTAGSGGGDTTPPSIPPNPRVSDLTCNSVTFSWDAATDNVGVTSYEVYHDGQFLKSVSGSTLSTSLTVPQGVTWGLYVNARDAADNLSQASDTVTIHVPLCQVDTEPPTAPTNLTASVSQTTVTLKWTAATDNVGVTEYDIYRDGAQVGSILGQGSTPATTYTDGGLQATTKYVYYVIAKDAAGNAGPQSNTASATTGSGCGTVCTVTKLTSDDDVPWGLVTLPDGTIVYNRRDSHDIIHLNPKTGAKTNLGTVPNVQSTDGEGGLLGLEINPKTFSSDHWFYIFHTSPSDNRIVRMKYNPATDKIDTSTEQVLLSGIQRNKFHNGGRLRFSPDGKYLFAGTGDAETGANAQNTKSLNGKVLRINPDGSIPSDNPFGNAVWSYGHRNVQGLAFDSQGRLWEQEFGNNVMDETNLITKGGNYGWPGCEGTSGSCGGSGLIAPKHTYPVAQGSCSGITIIRDVLYVACERGARLYREVISGSSLTNVTSYFQGTYGRIRTVEPAPDGGMWMSNSSGDKDSTPHNSNDAVYHVALG